MRIIFEINGSDVDSVMMYQTTIVGVRNLAEHLARTHEVPITHVNIRFVPIFPPPIDLNTYVSRPRSRPSINRKP